MSGKGLKVPFYNVRFLGVYLLPFCEIKSVQAEFFICYVTFHSPENAKKILRKNHSIDVRTTNTANNQVNSL